MENNPALQFTKKAFHRYASVMVFAVLGMVVGAVLMSSFLDYHSTLRAPQSAQKITATTSSAFARSAPIHLRIPKVAIDTVFEAPLGLNNDQTIEVPELFTTVGWYKNGATPGEVGTAVVLGHVDSFNGPAVFYQLPKLTNGDTIEIDREDGTTVIFVVDEIIRYSQDNFPTERVYGKTDTPQLRLVTCIGIFDKNKQKYSHNLVVYASLLEQD